LIARNAPERFERVLAAIHGPSGPVESFIERLPWTAGQLVTVLCVAPAPPLLSSESDPADHNTAGLREIGDSWVRAARERVLEAAQSLALAGLGPSGLVRRGSPVEQILAAARDLEADLIVVGGRRRPDAGGLRLGSVAARVVDRAPVSCLIVPTDTGA
ncbi:MAG TPA: universal stress protein, partial [Dehalococcoidia bacterium]|nr:universal stress protein [Dehalococcoidia bacterium]